MNMKLSLFYRGSLCMNDTVQSDTVRYISFSRGKKQKGDTRAKSKRDKNFGTFFVLWTGTLWHASKQSNFKPVHMSGSTAHDVAET